MDNFEWTQTEMTNELKLEIKGQISQVSELPDVDLSTKSNLILDLDGVSYINSAGIRAWMMWISKIAKQFKSVSINIEKLPSILIQHACTISDFFPGHSRIDSFSVAYYCENCEAQEDQLFVNGKDFGNAELDSAVQEKIENKICRRCGKKMEVETTPSNFFSILKTYR